MKIVINEELKKQEEINKNIMDFQKKIKDNRQNLGGVNAGLEKSICFN